MNGINKYTKTDMEDINHLADMALELTEDKRVKGYIKKIKKVTEKYEEGK